MANEELLGLLGGNDLAQFNQTVQQSDPYGIAGRTLGAFRPDMSTWSAPTQGLTAFGQAFLSGMLGNYAKQNAAQQTNALIGVLPQLTANPLSVAAPEGVDADAFATFKGNAILKNLQRKAVSGEESTKSISQLMNSVLGKAVENKQVSIGDAVKAIKTGDYSNLTSEPTKSKVNPMYSKALEMFDGNESLAEAYVKSNDASFADKKDLISGVDKANALAFTSKQFDDAKNLSSVMAMIPGTTAANDMVGIQTNLRTKIQQILGREMNGPEQEKLMAALPDWNDTQDQIEAKKSRFVELIDSLSKGGGGAILNQGLPDNAAGGANPIPTGQYTKSGKQVYILNGVKGVID